MGDLNIYGESQRIGDYTQLPYEDLRERAKLFMAGIPELVVPRQREEAGRILGHMVFEITMRDHETKQGLELDPPPAAA